MGKGYGSGHYETGVSRVALLLYAGILDKVKERRLVLRATPLVREINQFASQARQPMIQWHNFGWSGW